MRSVEKPDDFYAVLRGGKEGVRAMAAEKIRIFQGR